jgi:hypothetical protein
VPDVSQGTTYYATGDPVNARSCAQLDCELVVALSRGDAVEVVGQERGATFRQSDVWYQAYHAGELVYIHSALLVPNPPAAIDPPPQQPPSQPVQPTQPPVVSGCSCTSGDTLNCSYESFSSRVEAQACYEKCMSEVGRDVHVLDGNNDSIACNNGLN